MTKIPSKVDGPDTVGLGYWPHQVNAMLLKELQKSHNQLIDYLTAREELGDARHKELTSRIDTIEGNQLEMKGGKRCPEEDFGFEPVGQPKRWRAELGSKYWWVSWDGNVLQTEESEDDIRYDDWNYATGNYHPTREAAEAYKAKLLADNAQ